MALIIAITFDTGLSVEDSYVKVDRYEGTKELTQLTVGYYLNKEARLGGKKPLSTESYYFCPNMDSEENLLRQGYIYLKSLPRLAMAVDDLDI